MVKELFTHYRMGWNLENLKGNYRSMGGLGNVIIILPMYSCMMILLNTDEATMTKTDIISALALFLPGYFVLLSLFLHPIRLEKLYYLCPMTKTERLSYIKKDYLFRSLIHMFVLLTGYSIVLFLTPEPAPQALLFLLISLLTFSFVGVMEGQNTYVQIIIDVLIVIDPLSEYWSLINLNAEWDILANLFFGIVSIAELGFFFFHLKYLKKGFLAAAEYEESMEKKAVGHSK